MQVAFLIVDHVDCPELVQDAYWEQSFPDTLPYTVAAQKYKKDEFVGSAEEKLALKAVFTYITSFKPRQNIVLPPCMAR